MYNTPVSRETPQDVENGVGPPLGAPHGDHDGGGKKHSDQDDCEAKSLGMLRVLFYAPPRVHQLEHAFEFKAGLVGELGG
jgi:hypothetical protein